MRLPTRPRPFLLSIVFIPLLTVVRVAAGVQLLDMQPLPQRPHHQLIVQIQILMVAHFHIESTLRNCDGHVLVLAAALQVVHIVRNDQFAI